MGWTGYAFGSRAQLVPNTASADGPTKAEAKKRARELYRALHGEAPASLHAVEWRPGPDVLRQLGKKSRRRG